MRTLLACTLTALLCTAVTATAATVITGRQIKNGTVTGADVRNASITRADLSPAAQPSSGPQGPAGPTGPAGTQGPKGDAAAAGAHKAARATVVPGETVRVVVTCPEGQTVAAGGHRIIADSDARVRPVLLVSDFARSDFSGWQVTVRNDGEEDLSAVASAACAPAS